MTLSAYITETEGVLRSNGFSRSRRTWNRCFKQYIDVVDLQVAKSGDAVTINVGVLEREAFAFCWGKPPGNPVQESSCIVRARLGELVDNRDCWWAVNDQHGPSQVAEALVKFAIPYFERMHSSERMIESLEETGARRLPYPLPAIYLAILLIEHGESDSGFALLGDRAARATKPWRLRIDDIVSQLRSLNAGELR